MKKIRLDVEHLAVESFATERDAEAGKGTVRGYLSAYYELCNPGDTWQQSCTCEATCNARTCYNCGGGGGGSAGCGTVTDICCPMPFSVDPSCRVEC